MLRLTELQHDALVEIFNMGVGRAAAAMSRIVNEEVTMSVPTITLQKRADAAQTLGSGEGRRICAITQHFKGAFNTEAFLMFPEEKSLEIVRLMVGQSLSLEELSAMEQEAMSEIGNIILNACMATLANAAGKEMQGSLPTYHVGTGAAILGTGSKDWEGMVLTLKIDFNIERRHIYGYVAFLLDMPALHELQHYVDAWLARITG
ncbi:MAG TPA: chemotaxis protein CheX [Noviherbaspirillum sp.]|jgi:chemotaxis protein CheC|uniref:chemotaxis protein CheX n=1 Tax=Noviherbaspirillum sp. TaxID=1926288 RepID=UPI002F92CF71